MITQAGRAPSSSARKPRRPRNSESARLACTNAPKASTSEASSSMAPSTWTNFAASTSGPRLEDHQVQDSHRRRGNEGEQAPGAPAQALPHELLAEPCSGPRGHHPEHERLE